MTRRELMTAVARAGLIAALTDFANFFDGEYVMAQETQKRDVATLPPAYSGENTVKPLAFNAGKLKGLSEKLILSHHQNNYTGAVNRLIKSSDRSATCQKTPNLIKWDHSNVKKSSRPIR